MAKFCSECGAPLNGGKFCSECGAKAEEASTQVEKIQHDNSYREIDFERGYSIYGKGLLGLTSWVSVNYGIPRSEAKKLCSNFLETKKDEKAPNLFKRALNQVNDEIQTKSTRQNDTIQEKSVHLTKRGQTKQRIKENKANGIACCPKCGSTSLTANKKGFGIGKAVVGAALTGGIGLAAGNIGAKKVRVTCLNCGYQFFPKK